MRLGEGLRHEGGAQAVLLGDRLDHVLEEGVAVGGDERSRRSPSSSRTGRWRPRGRSGRAPAERQHAVADLGDDVVAAHQRLLVVAGLGRGVGGVGDGRSRPGVIRKNSHSTPVFMT